VQFPMTTDVYMAQRIAAGILEQSDLQKVIIYPSNFKTLPVEIGGTIKFSNTKMGWVEDTYRVNNYKLNDMQGIDLVLQEDNAAAYTDVATNEYTVSSQGVYIKSSPRVPAPTSFYVENVPNGISVNWNPPPARLYEYTNLYRNTVQSFDNADLISTARIDDYLDKNITAGQYFYFIEAVNFVGEVSTRAPAPDGVNSGGLEGLHQIKTQLLQDPSFELTPINTQQLESTGTRFWGGVSSGSGIGGLSSAIVRSEDVGTGGTHHLKMEKISHSNSGGPGNNPYAIDWFPITQGLNLQFYMRYRVPIYAGDTNSAFLDIPFTGNRSLRDSTGGTVREIRVNITNSTDWLVHSEELDVATFTNVLSFSIMRMGFQINHFSNPNTGTVQIDIDDCYVAFVP